MRYRGIKRWSLFAVMLIIVIIVNFPVIIVILNSFKSNQEIMQSTQIFPKHYTFQNISYVLSQTPFLTYLKSSAIVSIIGVLFSIVIAAFAGYGISRYRGKTLSIFSNSLLMLQMFPIILALIPLFIVFSKLHLINNYFSVILIYISLNLPFSIWMYKGFFDSIPFELEEAAFIDGSSRINTFFRIILPLSGPGIAAVAIFSFIFTWNEYLIANVFLRSDQVMTIPVGIQMFIEQYATDWGSLMAASTLAMLPVLILFLFLQKYFVNGAMAGAVKG
jgi:ABC-type glycerol-3-phosphate transport system permease component